MGNKLEAALTYVDMGWPVFPCEVNGKIPLIKGGFKKASLDKDQITRWWSSWPEANIGLPTGQVSGVVVLDVDVKNGQPGRASMALLKNFTMTLEVVTPTGGSHYYYKAPATELRCAAGILPGIDFRGDGGYVVTVPSTIDGKNYCWKNPDTDIALYPEGLISPKKYPKHSFPANVQGGAPFPEGRRNDGLFRLACHRRSKGADAAEIASFLAEQNLVRCHPPLPETELAQICESAMKYAPGDIGGAPAPAGPPAAGVEDAVLAALDSEAELSDVFVAHNAQDWRYIAVWGAWKRWAGVKDGGVWENENTLKIWADIRAVCAVEAAKIGAHGSKAHKRRLLSNGTIVAVEHMVRPDRAVAAKSDQWDADPMLLNTPGGVVDLVRGALRPARRTDYLTKLTNATPGSAYPTLWCDFLDRATAGDKNMQRYLGRVAGYLLTGSTEEQIMFFIYGTGANGKSVFLNTLTSIMGTYARIATPGMLIAKTNEDHPTTLAGLMGARLVSTIEVERGRHWAESKIKAMTGGDRMTARFMRQDFFDFQPQFKLVVAGNHKPGLWGVDDAIRRRFHIVPFEVTIPLAERDKNLPAKLLQEADGIMDWAVRGCMEWKDIGLKPPESIQNATDEYMESEDRFGKWLSECTISAQNGRGSANELFKSYLDWSEKRGERVNQTAWGREMNERGFGTTREQVKNERLVRYIGVALKSDAELYGYPV